MRTYTDAFVQRVAFKVQERAFFAGICAGLAFIGFAITDRGTLASVAALLLIFALGVSVGGWLVAHKFR